VILTIQIAAGILLACFVLNRWQRFQEWRATRHWKFKTRNLNAPPCSAHVYKSPLADVQYDHSGVAINSIRRRSAK
jgi:hypothetical protein